MSDEGVSMGANVSITVKRADGTGEKRLVISDKEISPENYELLERIFELMKNKRY